MSGLRLGARGLARLRTELSERDLAVLRSVAACRLLSARQIQRWHFPLGIEHRSATSAARVARRVLAHHVHHRLLVRLERRIGGVRAGSAGYVYALGPVGARVLWPAGPRRRVHEPSTVFLEHTLATAEVLVGLVEAARADTLDLLDYQTEPDCWRPYLGVSGTRMILKPDLWLRVGIGEYEHHWFVEVDRATAHLPALLRKCGQYRDYYRRGDEQQRTGLFPRVLWLTTPARVAALRARLHADTRLQGETHLFEISAHARALECLRGPELPR